MKTHDFIFALILSMVLGWGLGLRTTYAMGARLPEDTVCVAFAVTDGSCAIEYTYAELVDQARKQHAFKDQP